MVFRSTEQDLSLASSFSLHHLIQETRLQTVACSSPINLAWFLMLLGWWIGVHWRCRLEFVLDCLCHLAVWRRVVIQSLIAIHQLSWSSRMEPHWYLHESFITNDLGRHLATVVVHGLSRHSRQSTIDWCLLPQGCMQWCNGISSSLSFLPTCKMVSSKMMKACLRLANRRWVAPCFSSVS